MNSDLSSILPVPSRPKLLGRDLTTFAIGGALSLLVEPNTVDELQSVILKLKALAHPYRVLGAGSNILIPDHGITDVVIKLGRGFKQVEQSDQGSSKVILEVGAASALMTLSRTVSEAGLSGLEFAGGIPATLGGAVWMNAGAHGGEMSQVVSAITVITAAGEIVKYQRKQIPFAYRHSGLEAGSVVTHVTLELVRGTPQAVMAKRSECLAERKRRQPLTLPCAGSIFRNPSSELTAGMVLEKAGCKGLKVGGAEVSDLHANWIVNPKRLAKSEDVKQLIMECQTRARNQQAVELKTELVMW